jgi:NADPH:quinone reductase
MRAFTLDSFDTPPRLRDDIPAPSPEPNEVLVSVYGSSVNGADVPIAAGMLKDMVEYEFPVTLGRDFAGVAEQVGSAISRYRAGGEVFGFVPHADPAVHKGSWADQVAVREDATARKPGSVDFETAGAAPLAGISALAALEALELSEGAAVLVIGAAGGVGSFFVQLAAAAGANVITPGLPEDHEYLRGLGAAEVIERSANVAAQVREQHPDGVDALLDLVSFTPDDSVLKRGGRLASTLGAAGEGPGRSNLMAVPTTPNLERLAQLLDAGALRVPIQHTYPLEQAGTALDALPTTHTQGKLAITVG